MPRASAARLLSYELLRQVHPPAPALRRDVHSPRAADLREGPRGPSRLRRPPRAGRPDVGPTRGSLGFTPETDDAADDGCRRTTSTYVGRPLPGTVRVRTEPRTARAGLFRPSPVCLSAPSLFWRGRPLVLDFTGVTYVRFICLPENSPLIVHKRITVRRRIYCCTND